jgi:predicted nucleic acid-binding protein
MALAAPYLTDKSALARLGHPTVARRLGPLLTEGLTATCPIIDLEILYSARSLDDYEGILEERRAIRSYPIDSDVTDQANGVQHQLARAGRHRVAIPDLLIAAVARIHDLVVLHYDADFDRIAEVTGQPMEWVVPRGSI